MDRLQPIIGIFQQHKCIRCSTIIWYKRSNSLATIDWFWKQLYLVVWRSCNFHASNKISFIRKYEEKNDPVCPPKISSSSRAVWASKNPLYYLGLLRYSSPIQHKKLKRKFYDVVKTWWREYIIRQTVLLRAGIVKYIIRNIFWQSNGANNRRLVYYSELNGFLHTLHTNTLKFFIKLDGRHTIIIWIVMANLCNPLLLIVSPKFSSILFSRVSCTTKTNTWGWK